MTWFKIDNKYKKRIINIKKVTWFKDSGKIFETDRALMTVKGATWALKLSQLQPSDFGNYRYLFQYF